MSVTSGVQGAARRLAALCPSSFFRLPLASPLANTSISSNGMRSALITSTAGKYSLVPSGGIHWYSTTKQEKLEEEKSAFSSEERSEEEKKAEETSESSSGAEWVNEFMKNSKERGQDLFNKGKDFAGGMNMNVNMGSKGGKGGEGEGEGEGGDSEGSGGMFGIVKRFSSLVKEELKDMFDMKESEVSTTRRRPEVKVEETEYTGTTDVAVASEPEKSGWSKKWDELKDQAKTHAFFQKALGLKEHKLVQRANEVAEDLRDRWETSDNTFVHKIQDNLQETEFAAATREIRSRDPGFDMVQFLRDIKSDILPVMNAYLKGDMDVLKEHCSKEVCERVEAQQRFLKQEGALLDSRILDIKEVHLFDVKSFENSPLIIIRFALQQIKCVRDKYGNILEGAPDEIQAVDYLWALQQDSAGTYDKGQYLPPRWILRECQGIQEMKQIV